MNAHIYASNYHRALGEFALLYSRAPNRAHGAAGAALRKLLYEEWLNEFVYPNVARGHSIPEWAEAEAVEFSRAVAKETAARFGAALRRGRRVTWLPDLTSRDVCELFSRMAQEALNTVNGAPPAHVPWYWH